MSSSAPVEKFLKDYQPSAFVIDSVYLTFELSPQQTRVTNHMKITPTGASSELVLDGEHLTLISVTRNGVLIPAEQYQLSDTHLTLEVDSEPFDLEIVTEVNPEANTRLEGLYRSSGNYCTQCEAEGFRTITYFLDRPDVLTFFTTKVIGSIEENKVLLSNGNLVEAGELENGQHYAVWEDPYKKPCYLFALVAGNLEVHEDHFITKDGRRVDLRVYVQPQNIDKTDHAMASLKKSMQWDEERFGLVYDLDIYMIVAVDDFNMGAMENKGLNIFNSKFVLANPQTATDADYEGIEAVIAHEYFHNWTGNRVTCRDWFQLTLKEGLTVFRDQEFTADMLSPAVKRIEDVRRLRSFQFPEDAGPMSHPIQPQSYIEMNNFYTMTVYEKGAEVIRMYHTLLGEEGFRKGMDLYFDRFDGQAVTVEDFRNAMADANQVDLEQMHHWYIQSGTPLVKVTKQYDPQTQQLQLEFQQFLHQKQSHLPLLMPVRFGLLDDQGKTMEAVCETQTDCQHTENGWLFKFSELKQTLTFSQVDRDPYLSLFRGFSAPILLEYEASEQELKTRASHDEDTFVRWESMQTLALNHLEANVMAYEKGEDMSLSVAYGEAFSALMADESIDMALKALAMDLPDEHYVIEYLLEKSGQVNVDAIQQAQSFTRQILAENNQQVLASLYQRLNVDEAYAYNKQAKAKRLLKNRCLSYLSHLADCQSLAVDQYQAQQNMTDVSSALRAMKHFDTPQKQQCFEDFYQRWHQDSLVMDKWFALQAGDSSGDPLQRVKQLIAHQDFSYTNPNRVRSVIGVFSRMNLVGFHRQDGAGYAFLAEQVLKLDKINPQIAARTVDPFTQWKKFDSKRQALMKQSLQQIQSAKSLSKDVFEIVSKSLA